MAKKAIYKVFNGNSFEDIYFKTSIEQVEGLQDALSNMVATPIAHTHTIGEVTGLQNALDGKAASSHNHSGTYEPIFTKNTAFNKNFGTTAGTVVQGNDSRLTNARTPLSHTHAIADVTGLQTALDGKGTSNLTIGTTSTTAKAGNYHPTWGQVSGKPAFAPANAQKNSDITKAEIETSLGFTPENVANKLTAVRTTGATNTAYVTEAGIKSYVESMIGSVYRPAGDWNANTNSPALVNNTPANAGKVYRVSVAGTQFGFTFAIGDKLAFNASGVISKWDNVDDVTSVAGKTGAVVLTAADVGARSNTWLPVWSQINSKPSWITSSKPTYTAEEVGARPITWAPTWGQVTGKPTFHSVATSGSYNDLSNTPSIPGIPSVMTTTEGNTGTATTQRTINAANLKSIILNHSPAGSRPASDVSSWAKESSKPTYTASEVGARSNTWLPVWSQINSKPSWITSSKPTYTAEEVGAAPASHTHSQYLTSFTETDPTVPSWAKTAAPSNIRYLKMNADNTITWRTAAQFRGDIGAGTSNFSGSYNDLSNKPSIPAAQVQSNWNATTGMGVILNKPNLATVATSGSYNDLSNKPSIPAGTVTNVSAGTSQVGGLTLSVATGGTTPVITTSINSAANFRAAIGASPATHSHSIAQVTGLQTALGGKAASSHIHSAATTSADGFMSADDKTKLNGIATGAQVNVGTNLSQGARNTTTLRIDSSTGNNFTLPAATTSLAGLMTSTDKTKLNGIATGAQVNRTISSTAQAQTGTNNTTVMTPLRVKDAITANALVAGDNININANNVISATGAGFYELTKSKIETALSGHAINTIALGEYAEAAARNTTTIGVGAEAWGEYSTSIGSGVSTEGNRSTAVGYSSGGEGEYITVIGHNAYSSGNYSTALGYNAQTGSSSNTMRLGNTNLATLSSKVQLTVTSDIRDKTDIEEIPKALDFIKDLNPITYVGNDRDHYISEEQKKTKIYKNYLMVEDYDKESHGQGTKKGKRRRVGLSAQEVRDKLIEHYGSDNYANVVNDNFVEFEERNLDIPKGLENKLTMSYETMVPFLIKAIQEQQEQIEELKNQINKK